MSLTQSPWLVVVPFIGEQRFSPAHTYGHGQSQPAQPGPDEPLVALVQPIAEALLSQALLPILEAGDSVTLQPPEQDAATAALRWAVTQPGAEETNSSSSSTEDALIAVLRFVAGAAPVTRCINSTGMAVQ